MSGHHNHAHAIPKSPNKAFIIGIALNLAFVILEVITGFWTNSLSLLSDAGHNLSDVASLALALLAFRLAKVKATSTYTFGYRKATILVALLNAVILLFAVFSIAYEAIMRFQHPQPVQGKTVAIVALVGVFINSITAYFFMHDKEKDLNIKSAYLHLVADALVSLGVAVGGLVILYTNWLWLDSVLSLGIALAILIGTWGVLSESLRLTLNGVPLNIEVKKVVNELKLIPQVLDVHHVHIWAIDTTQNAMTAHVVVDNKSNRHDLEVLKGKIKHELEHFGIQHSTLEFEVEDMEEDEC
jgi:cobalt-zinc-cadmium efflux system protein